MVSRRTQKLDDIFRSTKWIYLILLQIFIWSLASTPLAHREKSLICSCTVCYPYICDFSYFSLTHIYCGSDPCLIFSMSTHTSRHLPDLADVVHAWKKAFTRSFSWSVKLGPIYCPTVKVRHQALLSTWLLGVSSPTRQGNCIDSTDSALNRSSKYLPALLIASWALWISISAVLLAYRKLCFSGYSAHQLRHLV